MYSQLRTDPHVGYVLKKFPRLSETFILNEILGLEELGVRVTIHSLRLPDDGRFHGAVGRVRAEVNYLPGLGSHNVYRALRSFQGQRGADCTAVFELLERLPERHRGSLLVQAIHLAQAVRDEGVTHLHAHFMTVAAHAACLAHHLTGIPFTVTAHAKDIFRETVDPAVFRSVASAAARIVTVTEFNRRFIADRFLDGDARKVVRIYNGIPLDEIATEEPAPERKPFVLAVGRLVEKKGFEVLLRATRLLLDGGTPIRVEIAGDGEERPRLDEAITRLGLTDPVSMLGAQPREKILARMREARLLAAPCITGQDGNRDALPTVLLEALALGLPPVSTPVGGIPEIIRHGREGLLVAESDPRALAGAIRRLLEDDGLWRACSAAARRKAEERFDRRHTLPQLLRQFRGPESNGALAKVPA